MNAQMQTRALVAEDAETNDVELCDLIIARQPLFLANRIADLDLLREALAGGDMALIQRIGHNCKGTGKGYGFPQISTIGLALETSAKTQDNDGVQASILMLDACVRQLLAARSKKPLIV